MSRKLKFGGKYVKKNLFYNVKVTKLTQPALNLRIGITYEIYKQQSLLIYAEINVKHQKLKEKYIKSLHYKGAIKKLT